MKASLALRAVDAPMLAAALPHLARSARGQRRLWEMRARQWVAYRRGGQRVFLRGACDPARRHPEQPGIWIYYILESGVEYEVNAPVSAFAAERYACCVNVETGAIERL